jgi:hypothetical protein
MKKGAADGQSGGDYALGGKPGFEAASNYTGEPDQELAGRSREIEGTGEQKLAQLVETAFFGSTRDIGKAKAREREATMRMTFSTKTRSWESCRLLAFCSLVNG